MTQSGPGVEGRMPDTRAPSPWPARVLAVLAAVVLLAYVPGVHTRGDVLRGALLPFLAAVAAAFALRHPGRPGPGGWRLALLLLPVAVPLLGAISTPGLGWTFGLRHAASWLALVGLSVGLVRVWRNEVDLDRAWAWLVCAGAVAAGWTMLEAVLRGGRGAGPFGRPGIAGPTLAALLVVALVRPRLPRGVRVAAMGLLLGGLVATFSRTGAVAAGVGALGALAAAGQGRTRRAFAAGLGVVALLAGLGFVLLATGALPQGARGDTVAVRVGLWKATARLVEERPLGGHGLGSFPSEILRVRDRREAELSAGRRPTVAHDDYLHVAAEGGVVAGLAFLVWIAGLLGLGMVLARRVPAGVERRRVAASGGALLALGVAAVGENVFLDPAPVLLAAVAAAGLVTLTGRAGGARRAGGVVPTLVVVGVACLLAAGVKMRDALADRQLRAYQATLLGGVDPREAATAAQTHLREGALAWRPDLPEAWYRLGVHRMKFGDPAGAREAWRKALGSDAGLTEAWLDIAASYEREARLEDARDALQAGVLRDPTRFDLHMRLGHLALGPEAVPGERPDAGMAEIEAHRHYNDAERLAPERFETAVARARLARRRGSLAEAGALLRAANEQAPGASEVLLESFRLEEVERVAHELVGVAILTQALLAEPALAGTVEREAERFLARGAERAAAAKAAVAGSLAAADYTGADRAYGAAARRLAGLLHARVRTPGPELAAVRVHEEAREWRPALARLRALLSWAGFEPRDLGESREERLHSRADLFLRAAQVAARVDAPLSRYLYARAHAAQGAYLLEIREWEAALGVLQGAIEEAPRDSALRLAHARALVRTGDLEGAEDAVLAALLLEPQLAAVVRSAEEFEALRERPEIQAALR